MKNTINLHTYQVIMGFDFGMKHIGVAVGQSITHTSSPLTTLSATDGIPKWEEIADLIDKWNPQAFIVGLPLNMDGTEQPMTARARRFINRLKTKFDLPVLEVDERLSSWEIEQRNPKLKDFKTAQSHSEVAALLIERWFNEH